MLGVKGTETRLAHKCVAVIPRTERIGSVVGVRYRGIHGIRSIRVERVNGWRVVWSEASPSIGGAERNAHLFLVLLNLLE